MPDLIPLPGEAGYSALPRLLATTLDDHVLQTAWDASGQWFAAMPTSGRILIGNAEGEEVTRLPGHAGGNAALAWRPGRSVLATYGHDGEVRLYDPPFSQAPRVYSVGKGWPERLVWNSDGSLLAVTLGRDIHVLDGASGELVQTWPDQSSTVADLVWNPGNPRELASVGKGGSRLWRVGRAHPYGGFLWEGASQVVTWSPDGRWVVTGDQTASIHIDDLHDLEQCKPLHINGFESRVKTFAWLRNGSRLAVGGGRTITLLPCRGKGERNNTQPARLDAHLAEVTCLAAVPKSDALLSAGRDGAVLLWRLEASEKPDLLAMVDDEITSLSLSPSEDCFVLGTHSGALTLYLMLLDSKPQPTDDL